MRNAALPYSTCSYCQSLLLREGLEIQDVGKAAVLPPDVSPIQLGTSLQVEGLFLTVVGRVRWGWADGSWNEWLLDGGDGTERWLGEAMGAFMLTAARPDLLEQPPIQTFMASGAIAVGSRITIEGVTLLAIDRKEAECLGSEGDLPFPTLSGRTMTSVDFRGPNREAVSLQHDERGASAWLGYYSDLGSLAPSNLRAINGWNIPQGLAR
ncbi:MAG: DUF4178 domain-containing protein [Novosphingobium sp.]